MGTIFLQIYVSLSVMKNARKFAERLADRQNPFTRQRDNRTIGPIFPESIHQ